MYLRCSILRCMHLYNLAYVLESEMRVYYSSFIYWYGYNLSKSVRENASSVSYSKTPAYSVMKWITGCIFLIKEHLFVNICWNIKRVVLIFAILNTLT